MIFFGKLFKILLACFVSCNYKIKLYYNKVILKIQSLVSATCTLKVDTTPETKRRPASKVESLPQDCLFVFLGERLYICFVFKVVTFSEE